MGAGPSVRNADSQAVGGPGTCNFDAIEVRDSYDPLIADGMISICVITNCLSPV
jgi:hypothetical protein